MRGKGVECEVYQCEERKDEGEVYQCEERKDEGEGGGV